MIAYHQSERLAAAALADLTAKTPSLLPLAQACEARFLPEKGGCNHAHLHAVVKFLEQPDLAAAAAAISLDRKITLWQAEGSVLSALNAASDLFGPYRTLLLDKGVVHAGGRFTAVGNSAPQIQFCRMLGAIAPSLRPVADHLFCAARLRRPGPDVMPERLLPFVAVQLLPRGTEREARMNALSLTVPRRPYAEGMAQAAARIVRSADQCGVMVPPHYLERIERPVSSSSRKTARRDHAISTAPEPKSIAARIATRFRAMEEQVLGLFRAA